MKLDAPKHYINRELSWLAFNDRVLHEALAPETPLLERLKFLAIVSSNLDEFFMVRVGGLKQLAAADVRKRCPAGLTPKQQLREIVRRVRPMIQRQYECLNKEILPALERRDIVRLSPEALIGEAADAAQRYFDEELFPVLTPMAVDEGHPFPRVAGLTIYLAARVSKPGTRKEDSPVAVMAIPRAWPRVVQIASPSGYHFCLIEDLVLRHIGRFFPGYRVHESALFRVTRNADLPVDDDDEATDLMLAMEGVLRERKAGSPVRLEVETRASDGMVEYLCERLKIDRKADLYRIDGPLDLKPFMRLSPPGDEELRYPAYEPQPVTPFETEETIWEAISHRDILVHMPYESFEPVARMVEEAASDPQVIAIKQTLYRTSSDSPIIAALERAARNGKAVTVLVELKARFDEEQNIEWAQRLAEAGAEVVYGVLGLKTHSKLLMVVRREAHGVRRYLHMSTGNYHDKTARLYEDIGLFTCDPDFGADGSNFFNAVTGYSEPRDWRQFIVAPIELRARIEEMISREIAKASRTNPGLIMAKLNSLLDADLVARLYEASLRHVRVRLCVRGICSLRPGVEGVSDNIEVLSVVGRYLEHSRIIHFRNGGQEEYYLSSADWMPRNLDRRIEVMFPVTDPAHQRRLRETLDAAFEDNQNAWRLKPDGTYEPVRPGKGEPARSCQAFMAERAIERAEALRARQRNVFRPKGPGVAPGLT